MIRVIKLWPMFLVFGLGVVISSRLSAKGLEDFVLADEEQTAVLNSEGINADIFYFHKDWKKRDSAPLIQLNLFADSDSVGDYSLLYESLSGKSENYQYLILDKTVRNLTKDSRVTGFEFIDDVNAFMFSLVYFEAEDQSIWMQYQLWYWSSRKNAKAKCVIASDVEERVSAFYEETISDSLLELMVMCNKLFQTPTEEDTPA